MLAWWSYATLLGAVLAVAAWAVERLAWRADLPARGIWATALLAGLVLPAIAWWRAVPAVGSLNPASASPLAPLGAAISAVYVRMPMLDAWLPGIWLTASSILALIVVLSHRHLMNVTRRCHAARIDGVRVWVGADEGPAVFGLWRPRILMPAWIAGSPARQRRFALIHELSHIRAGDLPLLWSAFAIVTVMPWNAAAWWILHRLRQSVEVDCDRRVLARHQDGRRAYGSLLIRAAKTRARMPALVSGLSSRSSLLRRRIERLGRESDCRMRPSWTLVSLVALCLLGAGGIPAPALQISTFGTVRRMPVQPGGAPQQSTSGVYRFIPESPGSDDVIRAAEIPNGTRYDASAPARMSERPARGRAILRERPAGTGETGDAGQEGGRPGGDRRR